MVDVYIHMYLYSFGVSTDYVSEVDVRDHGTLSVKNLRRSLQVFQNHTRASHTPLFCSYRIYVVLHAEF